MSRSTDFINVDPETGDTCVMYVKDGVCHEVHATQMGMEPQTLALAEYPSIEDDRIEEFVKSFELSYPRERD